MFGVRHFSVRKSASGKKIFIVIYDRDNFFPPPLHPTCVLLLACLPFQLGVRMERQANVLHGNTHRCRYFVCPALRILVLGLA